MKKIVKIAVIAVVVILAIALIAPAALRGKIADIVKREANGKCGNLYRTNIGKSNGSGKIHYGQIACVGNGLSGKYSCSAYTKDIG